MRLEVADFPGTRGEVFRNAVQNRRGLVGIEEVAGKHVAAEQKVEFPTEETAVAHGVAGEMNHLQAAPEWQHLSIGQKLVNLRRLIVEHLAPDSLQAPAPTVDALVRKGAVNVPLFSRVGVNFGARPAL